MLLPRTLPVVMSDNNNEKSGAPPAAPPPPPPVDLGDSMDSQPDFSFNLELSRNQQDLYDLQFSQPPPTKPPPVAPQVTIVGELYEHTLEPPHIRLYIAAILVL